MKTLIIKNILTECPGTIEDYLRMESLPYHIVDLYVGDELPDLENFSHLVIMGGPMAVYEMDKYPFLKKEAKYIEKAINQNKYILGICLGSQLLANVLGGRVYAGHQKEIGWYKVTLTEDAMNDPIISELSIDGNKAEVFQWHGDTFDLPEGAVRLAFSELYLNQAFRFSDKIYALQFHIEVTPAIINDWFKDDSERDKMVSETERIFVEYYKRARNFYKRFFTSNYKEKC